MITKAYQKFDDGLMYLANKAVKAYNWTFGRTKADLANELLTVAPILEGAGFLQREFPQIHVPLVFMFLHLAHISQKDNKHIEHREIEASKSNCKDLAVENYKNGICKLFPAIWLSSAVIQGYPSGKSYADDILTGTGNIIRASSYYIMRADSLPPKKHCLSRAKDKIKAKLAERRLTPQPAYVQWGLEDRISLD